MKRSVQFILIVFVCFLISNCAVKRYEPLGSAEKGFILTYHPEAGTKFTIVSTATSEIVMNQMGTEVVVNVEGEGEDSYEVISVDNEAGITFELEYREKSDNVESPAGSGSTDYSELVGKKAIFVVSPLGKTSGFEGFENLPEITTALQETTNKDQYISGVKAIFPMLPGKAVKFGDTWTETDEREIPASGGKFKIVSNVTYKLIEEAKKDGFDCVKIEATGTIKTTGSGETEGMSFTLEREANATEIIYFAYRKGMYISREGSSKQEGIVNFESIGMEMPQEITGKSSVIVKFIEK
jgi:hypothetical protein